MNLQESVLSGQLDIIRQETAAMHEYYSFLQRLYLQDVHTQEEIDFKLGIRESQAEITRSVTRIASWLPDDVSLGSIQSEEPGRITLQGSSASLLSIAVLLTGIEADSDWQLQNLSPLVSQGSAYSFTLHIAFIRSVLERGETRVEASP